MTIQYWVGEGRPETSSQRVRDVLSCFEGRADIAMGVGDEAWVPEPSHDTRWLLCVSGPVRWLELARLYLLQGPAGPCHVSNTVASCRPIRTHETAAVVRGCCPGPTATGWEAADRAPTQPQGRLLPSPVTRSAGLWGSRGFSTGSVTPDGRVGWQQGAASSLPGHIQGEGEAHSLQGKPPTVKARRGQVPGASGSMRKQPSPVLPLSALSPRPPPGLSQQRWVTPIHAAAHIWQFSDMGGGAGLRCPPSAFLPPSILRPPPLPRLSHLLWDLLQCLETLPRKFFPASPPFPSPPSHHSLPPCPCKLLSLASLCILTGDGRDLMFRKTEI